MHQQQQSRVQLLVYDLSRGMALAMSQQILGQQIEGIWHTGIQVFDIEYFFGGGIQAQPAGLFPLQHQMPPVRTLDLGVTSKTKSELQAFLLSIHNRFNASTYDLTRNNCNNFSDTVSQFLTGQRIPSYIVDLPSIVFNTPGGAMLRPMIENMQNAVYSQGQNNTVGGTYPQQNLISAGYIQGNNMANAASSISIAASAIAQTMTPATLEDKPLVSSDYKTSEVLGNKIIALKSQLKNDDGIILDAPALSEADKCLIKTILQVVSAASSGKTAKDICSDYGPSNFAEDACRLLTNVIASYPTAQMACLFLMRLLILEESLIFNDNPAAVSMVDMLVAKLSAAQGTAEGLSSVPSIVMGLCTLANLLSNPSGQALILDRTGMAGAVVDLAVGGLSHPRVEVRQMSATVAYNFTMAFSVARHVLSGQDAGVRLIFNVTDTEELNPLAVQLLCGAMEEFIAEKDNAVRYRRLCVALKVVRLGGSPARSLGRDLGFRGDLSAIVPSSEAELRVVEELKTSFL